MYLLMKEIIQADLKDDDSKDPFFDSFHFMPYLEPEYYTYQPDGENFKVQMVSKPQVKPDTSNNYNKLL